MMECETCAGNGEIVTDWERYLHPHEGDCGDEAVSDCPDCDGLGQIDMPDPDLERIMAMTEEEIDAALRAEGKDPETVASEMRALIERLLLAHQAPPTHLPDVPAVSDVRE